MHRPLRHWRGPLQHAFRPEGATQHAGEQFHCLRAAGGSVLRHQFLAAGTFCPASTRTGDDALARVSCRADRAGRHRAQNRRRPEIPAA
ncbi:hypothetical protein D3C84_943330 [compost metagenome]